MIEIITGYQSNFIHGYYDYFKKILGHSADIYFPLSKPSIYSGTDQNHEYSDIPDISDNFIFINVIDYNVGYADSFLDNFLQQEPHMLVRSSTDIPNGSKVVINTFKGRKEYTTDLVLSYVSSKDMIINKIVLLPRSF